MSFPVDKYNAAAAKYTQPVLVGTLFQINCIFFVSFLLVRAQTQTSCGKELNEGVVYIFTDETLNKP